MESGGGGGGLDSCASEEFGAPFEFGTTSLWRTMVLFMKLTTGAMESLNLQDFMFQIGKIIPFLMTDCTSSVTRLVSVVLS